MLTRSPGGALLLQLFSVIFPLQLEHEDKTTSTSEARSLYLPVLYVSEEKTKESINDDS